MKLKDIDEALALKASMNAKEQSIWNAVVTLNEKSKGYGYLSYEYKKGMDSNDADALAAAEWKYSKYKKAKQLDEIEAKLAAIHTERLRKERIVKQIKKFQQDNDYFEKIEQLFNEYMNGMERKRVK